MEIHCSHDRLAPLVELVPKPRNSNKHSKTRCWQRSSSTKVGAPIIVSNRSGIIVAGHRCYEAAKLPGMESGPVNFQGFATDGPPGGVTVPSAGPLSPRTRRVCRATVQCEAIDCIWRLGRCG